MREVFNPGDTLPFVATDLNSAFTRDYREMLDWAEMAAPSLPQNVIRKTSAKYREAFARLTGCDPGKSCPLSVSN
ncbi:MAG: hypothetical protein DME60_07020 [Verrucomicrobia bacterium]|nr:MAG: hypothetical protein DME60_07020 [Verrucomicrobiota bacterium]